VERAVDGGPGQAGSVRLAASPGALYDTLWQTALRLAALLAGLGIALLLLLAAGLRLAYPRLLGRVAARVGTLLDPACSPPPRLERELSSLADAAQRLRLHMQASLREHAQQIEALRDELQLDPITRLPNRKRFLDQLQQQLWPSSQPGPEPGGGHLMVFRLRGLAALNHRMPRHHTDQWLRAMAQRMRSMLGRFADAPLLARLNGSDFGVLMPASTQQDAERIAERIRRELLSINVAMDDEGHMCRWALAFSAYRPGQQAGALLAMMDHALMRAESEETDSIVVPEAQPAMADPGEYAWRDTLLTALDQHRFSLAVRPVLDENGVVLCHQGQLMLHQDHGAAPVAAPAFMPAAVRLGLAAECDIQAVRLALDWLMSNEGRLVMGLSWSSLGQGDFLPRLRQLLLDRPDQACRLLVETHALSLIEQREDMLALTGVLTGSGAGLGLRGLAQQLGAMTHLHELQLAYIKLGGEFVKTLADSPGNRRLAEAVVQTALSLGMKTCAENAGDASTAALLRNMGVCLVRIAEA